MKLRLCHGDLHLAPLRTRMPFKYGIATMTETTYAFVRLRVEIDGRSVEGIAADSLPPKWFTKDPLKPLAEEVAEMLAVIRHALAAAVGLGGENAFEIWRQLEIRWDFQAGGQLHAGRQSDAPRQGCRRGCWGWCIAWYPRN